MKLLIVGNGNLTRRRGCCFVHHENVAFLRETLMLGLKTEYASIVLDASWEQLNLADAKFPEEVRAHLFPSLARIPRAYRFFAVLQSVARVMFLVARYDFVYCYYPGALSKVVTFFCRLLHRPYGLNVRGEVPPSKLNIRTLKKARFILADGAYNVTRILPEYENCHEIVPMCAVFNADLPLVPKTRFGKPLRGLFVGRVERPKGVFELFDALAELKRQGVEVEFTFIGAYGEETAAAVKARELSDRVFLTGMAKTPQELEKSYRDADFFCLPSYTEGFPRVLYEAMAHALPCLTTMVGGIPSRMREGENCLALKPRDVDSIVRAISALASDPALAERLSRASIDTFVCWKRRFAGGSHAKQLSAMIAENVRGEKCH